MEASGSKISRMENEIKTSPKMPVARDGQVIGEFLGKEFRGLKTQGVLRPSDHIFKKGEWQMLFKASEGYFWESQESSKYMELFNSEMQKAKLNIEAYKKMGEETQDQAKKAEYAVLQSEYAELAVYLQRMQTNQTYLWAKREQSRIEFELRVKQNQKEMAEEDKKDYWKRVKRNKAYDKKLFFDFLLNALKGSRKYRDYLDFIHEGNCGEFPCIDWPRRLSEEEFKRLKSLNYKKTDLEAYSELFWQAVNEQIFNKDYLGKETQEAEQVLRKFLGWV